MFKPTFNVVNVLLLFLTNLFVLSNSVKINTPQGVINGLTKSSSSGREFQAFLGIPYAKPPLNNLRFQDPLAFGSWEGVYDGTKEGPACLQKHIYDNKLKFYVIGEEDCLYINVYTPNTNKLKKYAVMVFIHGGGFTCGSSSSAVYGPEFLVEKDVVLVTFNYRLGPLGFASTEDIELPGNYGLKDQVLALKWIQENIAAYGGDPDSVTIFGQSAGGASVHYHMMSPLSKGLFHRGIPMSGSAHCPWALGSPGMTRRRTIKIATALGCPSNSSKEIVDCLRSVSAHKLTDSLSELTLWGSSPVVPLPPVIEPKEVKNAFITFDPYNEKPTTPMMLGLTSEEGAFVVALFKSSPEGVDKTLKELNDDFNRISKISVFMYQDENINNYDELSENLRKFYFGEKTINKNTLTNVTNLYTDACLTQCTVSTAKHHKGPVYFYYFAQKGPHSVTHLMSNSTEYFGVSHSDDLMYLFPLTLMVPARKTLTEQEEKIKNEMVTLWTNFAKYGDPTPDKKWKEMSSEDINYLHIEDEKFEMRENLLTERVKFWENLVWRTNRVGISEKDEL